jgi:hypothetical protein
MISLQIEAVTAALPLAPLVQIGVFWQFHGFDKLRAGQFASSARCDVVRIAHDPQRLDAVVARQGLEQLDGSGGILTPFTCSIQPS